MRMFVVYENPRDYPGHFVVREWWVGDPHVARVHVSPHCTVVIGEHRTEALLQARSTVPPGFTMVLPSLHDDPVIKEVWL